MSIAAPFGDGPGFGVERREFALWSLAAAAAFAVHLSAWFYITSMPEVTSPPAQAPAAISIELAPVAVAPEAVPTETAELVDSAFAETVTEPVETAEPNPDPEPVVEEVTETEVPAVEPTVVPEITETAEAVQPDTAEPVPEITEALAETPEPVEEVIPDLVEVPLPEVAVAVPEQRPAAEKPKPAKKVEQARKPARKLPPKRKPAPPQQNASRKSAENAPRTAAAQASQGSSGSSVSPARWQSRVNAHLNRHKRSANGSGIVSVRFAITSSGSVIAASVARSSGDPSLDQEAVSLVRRSSPVPAPPPEIARSRMTLTVPIAFR